MCKVEMRQNGECLDTWEYCMVVLHFGEARGLEVKQSGKIMEGKGWDVTW